jgi:hypothetical protein
MLKRKIKVGYDDLEIKKIEFHPSKDNDSFGEFKSAASTIEIAKGMQPRQEANTFLHEILHACVYQSGLNSDTYTPSERVLKLFKPRPSTRDPLSDPPIHNFRDPIPWSQVAEILQK